MGVDFSGDEEFYSKRYQEFKIQIRNVSGAHNAINYSRLIELLISSGWRVCYNYPRSISRGGYRFKFGDGQHYFKCRIYPYRSVRHAFEIDEFGVVEAGTQIKLSGKQGRLNE